MKRIRHVVTSITTDWHYRGKHRCSAVARRERAIPVSLAEIFRNVPEGEAYGFAEEDTYALVR